MRQIALLLQGIGIPVAVFGFYYIFEGEAGQGFMPSYIEYSYAPVGVAMVVIGLFLTWSKR